ncbi:MAG TPA: TlpA disulfide reductase family protein [Candidatus Polarisedimenticolaceae bacterium]|nr:TlpA disulfide reductase family protein [Candidatus Polarisedimenticolaceae bacterium]
MLPVSLTVALFLAGSVRDAAPVAAPAPVPADAAAVQAAIREPGAAAVLVNVWATWCAPCREEFPDLLHVAREFKGAGLRTVLVSSDFEEGDGPQKFLSEQGVDFATYIKTGKDEEFINSLSTDWSGALPATFVYDAQGRLVRFWEGKASYPIMKKRVQEALARKENP